MVIQKLCIKGLVPCINYCFFLSPSINIRLGFSLINKRSKQTRKKRWREPNVKAAHMAMRKERGRGIREKV